MPLCPIRKLFNYTFIAFVDAGLPENDSQRRPGTERSKRERTTRNEGGKKINKAKTEVRNV